MELEHAFDYQVRLAPPVMIGAGRTFHEALGGDEVEHGVAQEFQALVVFQLLVGVLVEVGAMGQRPL